MSDKAQTLSPDRDAPAAESGGDSALFLAAITLFGLIGPYTFLVSPVITGQMATQMSWSAGTIGLLMAGELAGASLISIPAMWLLRGMAPRRLAAISAILFIVANVASGATTDITAFFAARVIAGAAGGVLSVICLIAAARSANPPRAFAFWTAGQTVSAAVGLFYLPNLFTVTGLGGVYDLLAVAGLVALVTLGGFAGERMALPPSHDAPKRRAARFNLLAIFAYYIAIGGAWAFAGIPASEIGFSDAGIGALTSGAMTAGILGSILASYVGGSSLRGRFVMGSYALLLGCFAVITLTKDHLLFSAAIIVLQVLWSFLVPLLLASLAESDDSGVMVILSNMIIGGGAALGPLLAGYTIDWTGGYHAVALEGAAILVLSILAYARARWSLSAGVARPVPSSL